MPKSLALIGCGYWGKNLARNFNALGALHTLSDVSQELLNSYGAGYEAVAKTTAINEVILDPNIPRIAIAAPAVHHFALAKSALEAGKDVFVEKPLCLKVSEGMDLVKLAAERGRILMVGHLLQYHPCVEEIQRLVAGGDLGKLYHMSSNRLNLGKIRREENALWSFAPHDISVLLSLAGHSLPESVRSVGEAYLTPGVPDSTLTTLKFDGSLRGHVYVNWLNPFKEQKLTVVGSDGMIVFDDTKAWKEKLVLHRHYLTWDQGQIPMPNKGAASGAHLAVPESEPLRNECAHFLECCETRRTPKTDGAEGLRVLQVLEAAQISLDADGESASPKKLFTGYKASASPAPLPDRDQGTRGASGPAKHAEGNVYTHPTAVVDAGAELGAGTKIWHFAHISPKARIGERCILGQNTFVADGVEIGNNVKIQNNVAIYTGTRIEDDVFLGPSCVLTNVTNPRSQVVRHSLYEKTLIRRGATVGANATIVCGVTIGRYAFVAAGAVVTKDVPDYGLVLGNPARRQGWMSRHGHRLVKDAAGVYRCPESGYRYEEQGPDQLKCVDFEEDRPLPPENSVGKMDYEAYKKNRYEGSR